MFLSFFSTPGVLVQRRQADLQEERALQDQQGSGRYLLPPHCGSLSWRWRKLYHPGSKPRRKPEKKKKKKHTHTKTCIWEAADSALGAEQEEGVEWSRNSLTPLEGWRVHVRQAVEQRFPSRIRHITFPPLCACPSSLHTLPLCPCCPPHGRAGWAAPAGWWSRLWTNAAAAHEWLQVTCAGENMLLDGAGCCVFATTFPLGFCWGGGCAVSRQFSVDQVAWWCPVRFVLKMGKI